MPQRNLELVIDFLSYKLSQKGDSWNQLGCEEENRIQAPERAESEAGPSNATNGNPSQWHHGDSPMASGAAGHNRSLDAPDVVPLVAVKPALREAGDNFEGQYWQAFHDLTAELRLTPETARHTFEQVMDKLFWDEVSWGRIVAFFSFGGALCLESRDKEMKVLMCQIASWMAPYLNDHLDTWIQDHGGWNTFVECHVNNVAVNSWMRQESFNCYFLMGMTVAGMVLLGWLFSRK
ncbi:bcl-2-like protein 1 [Ictidomys tridecemlineatus]|uniref:bcl-2-like protein 1 n=1 Tax=Ictidomys tridecemlineatus TaxID=43179 RepID=UPI00038BB44F|nr:bcl-2-like protein 1 [Ictidomys tridecemlineatus]KAG3289695.1 bcl-2-like protein 1 [Ictidomys tridecemlineatus]